MLVLSLASGRPAPHNDPFIRLREPWARVSSDKGGRRAPVPLLGSLSFIFSYWSWKSAFSSELLLSSSEKGTDVKGLASVYDLGENICFQHKLNISRSQERPPALATV